MEIVPSEAKTLREMVTKEWFPHEERELEATFGVDGVVDSTRFLAVAQRLKSKGFKEVRQPDRLTISLEDNTRYTIQGEGTIAQYCQDNKVAGKSAVIMIKDRAGDLHTLDIKEYDTRIKIRRELPLDANDPRVKSHMATWDQRVKFFRLIQRWTFIGKGCIYDLSMVRSTKKDDRGLWKQVTKFYDEDKHHNIMKEKPSYEIEVELDRESEDANTPDKAIVCLIQGIGDILRGIQRNPILIRNSIKNKVLDEYKRLVGATEEPGKKGFRGVQPVTLERVNFIGLGVAQRKPSIRVGYNVTDKADGLRTMGYCDEKGELFLLDMGLNIYRSGLKKLSCKNSLVDGEWITKNKDGEAIQMYMLFDIYIASDGKDVTQTPFHSEFEHVPTRYKELLKWTAAWRSEGGPISLVKGLTPQNSMKVMEKKFFFASGSSSAPSTDIFVKCGQMLSRSVNYNTDGLILTANDSFLPERFGVRFPTQFKWKPSEDNTVDFLVKIVKNPDTNQDKLTDIIRPDSQDTIKYKSLRLYIGTSADPGYDDPRRTVLLVKKLPSGRPGGRGGKRYRMRPVLFNPKEYEDSMASVCYLDAKEDLATGEWVVRCSTKDDAPGEATGDPITNNSIVEMRYDANPTLPGGWNWVPIRVRYDKTERFQGGAIDKTLNSIETAESVWKSIHDPITHHMITTGDLNPSEEEKSAIQLAQEKQASLQQRYYQKKSSIRNVSLVKSMANFHNLAIKGNILTKPILSNESLGLPRNKKVIDTSVGKGGDLKRYMDNVSFLLGIDIDAEGIRDPDEGAYRRYLDQLVEGSTNRFMTVPPMLFLIGDSSKSYADGKSGINEEEADMMRSTFGKTPPAAKVPPYVEGKCKGQLKEGADLITSMFSIHYYFESKNKWEGFLHNIRDNLKVGGFFVCCCFDGNLVADILGDNEKGESIVGTDPTTNSTLWRLTKENTLGSLLPDTVEEGFGHAIDVEFLSIGSIHREYLVSFGLLTDQLHSIGCELASPADCYALGIPAASQQFIETYEGNLAHYGSVYPMTDEVKMFSFFNRWYVFRRYGTAPGVRELPKSPAFEPNSPPFVPTSPAFVPSAYAPTSPAFVPSAYAPTSPAFVPSAYAPTSPAFVPSAYAPTSPAFFPKTPEGPGGRPPYSPKSPEGPGGAAPYSPKTPLFFPQSPEGPGGAAPESPYYAGMARTPDYTPAVPTGEEEEAAALATRPRSAAWASVPLSGNAAQDAALRIAMPRSPPIPPGGEVEPLPPSPVLQEEEDAEETYRKWQEKKDQIEAAAKAREAAGLPAFLPPDERERRLTAAAEQAVQKSIQKYKEGKSGLVTAVVIGGARTVAVERSTASGPQKKYEPNQIFRFFGKAELKDSLGIGDAGAARWLSLSAPFPIRDKGVEYPTVNHYLAAMKYKLATDKPELAEDLFSKKGTIHTKYLRLRDQIASKHKAEKESRAVKENEDQELLRSESADVAEAALPKMIKRYGAEFDESKWLGEKHAALKEALKQRWNHDARFRTIVEAARTKEKYLLYYTGSSTITALGGIRRKDGQIEGENQVGKIIMDLAGFPNA